MTLIDHCLPAPDELKILETRALGGPNQWTTAPVLECLLDLGAWDKYSSADIPGFNERLASSLPGLVEHRCSIGKRGGFLERLRFGTYLAHIIEHVALELHGLAGVDIYFGRARETSRPGVYRVVIKYKDEALARDCILASRELCLAAAAGLPFDLKATVDRLCYVARESMLPADLQAVVDAAVRRNIPWIRVGDSRLVQFGQGVHLRRMLGMRTDRLPALTASLHEERELLEQRLTTIGIPLDAPSSAANEAGNGSDPSASTYRLLMIGGRMVAALENGRDVTDQLDPAIAETGSEVIGALKWDLASLDVRAGAPRTPLENRGGALIGLRPDAELGIHLAPAEGQSRPVSDLTLDLLFPNGENGRIPVIAVTGTNGKTTVARLIAHILKGTGKCVGLTCTDGIYIDGRRIITGDRSGPASARQVLMHPRAQVAVLETARGGILRAGLGFDMCDVAVVTNLGRGDHLGSADVHTVEQLAKVKGVVVEVVSPHGTAVLNAADPLAARMAENCRGAVMFFAQDPENDAIRRHLAAGGRAVFVREGAITFASGEDEEGMISLERVPLTMGGRVPFQIENVLAAAAAASALGVSREAIVQQLATFSPDLEHDPTRFNLFNVRGATVIVDFGHNADALAAVIQALDRFPHTRRSAVYSSSGDRRDEDILRMGELLGAAFDRVILYEDDDLWRRRPGEIIALLRRGLARSGRAGRIEEVQGGLNALRHGLDTVEAGELLLIQAHMADPTVAFLGGRPDVAPSKL